MVGLGSTLGPFIAAGFTNHSSWRNTFYLLSPISVLAAVVLFFKLPPQAMPKEDLRVMAAKVDWVGIILSSGGTILLLIPVSGIGSHFQVDSPLVISMLTLGAVFLAAFVFNEWKLAKLPMIPCKKLIFKQETIADKTQYDCSRAVLSRLCCYRIFSLASSGTASCTSYLYTIRRPDNFLLPLPRRFWFH